MLSDRIERLFYRCSSKRVLCGIEAGSWVSRAQQEVAFTKVEEALSLIRTYAPLRFLRLQQDVVCIFVSGPGTVYRGTWRQKLRMCQLQDSFVLDPETSAAALAVVLVHEGMHARLDRLGFGYEERQRVRFERICFRAERAFARRLPGGEPLVEEAERMIAWYSDPALLSNAAYIENDLQTLRDMHCPEWSIQALVRVAKVVKWLRSRQRAA